MREETLVTNLLRHKRVIEGMLTAMVGDAAAAEDLFQEMAIIMTRKREETEEECRFVAWARAIAINLVRDHRKKYARRRIILLDPETLEAVAGAFEEVREPLWDLRREALLKCTEKLPERERRVLRRRYEEALPTEQVAREFKTTRGAVDTLLYRLRRALHQCVQGRLQKLEPS